MKSQLLAIIAGASAAYAQAAANVSICDKYSAALLGASNATTQYTLLTLLVNTAVIGNYSNASKIAVPGILAQGQMYNNTPVNLLPFFNGALASSNRGGKTGVSVNFLDDGGAAPLMANKPANGENSNQYMLLTHLYELFGILLGCSDIGMPGYPAYSGDHSMYETHKFMALNAFQVQYFIEQVGLSAASFGVAVSDIETVGHALQNLFGYRCAPPVVLVPGESKELQSVCTDKDCPISPHADCGAYHKVAAPQPAQSSGSASGLASASASASGSGSAGSGSVGPSASASAVAKTGAASKLAVGLACMIVVAGGSVFMLG